MAWDTVAVSRKKAGRSIYENAESGQEFNLAAAHYKEVFYAGLPRISPQFERGAIGSVIIVEGVKLKLLAIWFGGNQSLSICWKRTPVSLVTACRQQWMTGLAGEREPCGVD